ncbi:MAG: DUF6706 family protein [Bacteroidota bacterium]
MTNKERLLAMLGFSPSPQAINAALIDFQIQGDIVYDGSAYPLIRLAAIRLMEVLITTPNVSNGEAGLSTTYDRGAIERRIASLKSEINISAGKSIARGFSW